MPRRCLPAAHPPLTGEHFFSGSLEADPGGFFKLAEPILVRIGKRQFESDLANLKDLMEADAL